MEASRLYGVLASNVGEPFVEFGTKPGLTSDTGLPPEKSQSLVSTSPLPAISQALSSHPFSPFFILLSTCDTSLYHLYSLYFPLFSTLLYTI